MTTPESEVRQPRLKSSASHRPLAWAASWWVCSKRIGVSDTSALRDAPCVARDSESGEVQAIDLALARAGAGLVDLLDFRAAPVTDRAGASGRSGGVEPLVLRSIGTQLERGSAVVAVLNYGADVQDLERAVAQCGGEVLVDERVSARALVELGEWLAERVATGRAQSTMRGSPP